MVSGILSIRREEISYYCVYIYNNVFYFLAGAAIMVAMTFYIMNLITGQHTLRGERLELSLKKG